MTQLTFQPALDPFHSVFRLLRLRPLIDHFGPMARERVRILDFYLLFPFRIREMRLPRPHQRYKQLAEKYSNLIPYGELPDPPLLFARMEPMQAAALETLQAHSLLEIDKANQITIGSHTIPDPLARRAADLNAMQADLIDCLGVLSSEYELYGPNGLKARTGLMEHRYDAV